MKNIFKTANNNRYLYRSQEQTVMYLHPLVEFFSDMEDRGASPVQWLEDLDQRDESHVNIENLGVFAKKEIVYYFTKYNLLKEKNYFSSVRDEQIFRRRLTGHDIENLVTCCDDVTFEVTKACNLDCRYCIQGELYRVHDKHQPVNIDRDKAKLLLDYLRAYWTRPLSPERITIKFYGGEPLMNIGAIKEIVDYTKTLESTGKTFSYYITTNGVLLDQYLDYLVANDFFIAISLDGDQDANSHRVFPSGNHSFEKITANINRIRDNYPSYFNEKISFQSVLHNRNSITHILGYFEDTYQKHPFITGMNGVGVNQDRQEEFDDLRASIYQNLYYGKDYPLLEEKKLNELPRVPGSGIITHDIYDLLLKSPGQNGKALRNTTPTGTCHPFSKGIFLSTDGKILPCERIDHKYALGYVGDEVILDFGAVAGEFNRYYDKMNRLCLSCANAANCKKCLFSCGVEEPNAVCKQYCDEKDFLTKLSGNIGYMEDKPGIHYKHLTETGR